MPPKPKHNLKPKSKPVAKVKSLSERELAPLGEKVANEVVEKIIDGHEKTKQIQTRKSFEIMFLSFVISTVVTIFVSLILLYFEISVNVVLPVIAPIWIGSTTLIFMAWKES